MRSARSKRSLAALATVLLVLSSQPASGKTFSRCALVGELLKLNFSKTYLASWICLVESESQANTKTISHGYTTRYGLFQIPNRKYCMEAKKGGLCNIACSSLLDDDLVENARCAKLIYDKEGFKHWSNWLKQCKGKPLPVVNNCNEYTSTLTKRRALRSVEWQSGSITPSTSGHGSVSNSTKSTN